MSEQQLQPLSEKELLLITDEPVRGSVPPNWFWALPGIERLQLFIDGLLPLPPLWRLLGIRPAHLGPGSGTWIMPASRAVLGLFDNMDISMLVDTALSAVAMTTLPPNVEVRLVSCEISFFRPARPQQGNLLARGRVVNQSRFFSYVSVDIEDPQGRQIAHATSHLELRNVATPLAQPPEGLQPVEEPSYATPDPYLRTFTDKRPPSEAWQTNDILDVIRQAADGTYDSPLMQLMGFKWLDLDKGRTVISLPSSPWFCRFSRTLAPACLVSASHIVGFLAGATLMKAAQWAPVLTQITHYFRPVLADGRPLRVEAQARLEQGKLVIDGWIDDADGNRVMSVQGIGMQIDSTKRQKRTAVAAEPILATLMFVDIVESTKHAERLGGGRWRALLDEHHSMVRAAVDEHGGVVVDAVGDGFFIRFEAPARALRCARAICEGVKPLGIAIRGGIHVGECELKDGKLTGLAVHIAARIGASAKPGEVYVSSIVKELTASTRAQFEDRGRHRLKGVPGEWQLFALLE